MKHAEELRAAINRGETGDKVRWPDPSAAPLGTDEEAAGQAISHDAVHMTAMYETTRPHHRKPTEGLGAAWVVVASTALIGAAVTVAVLQ